MLGFLKALAAWLETYQAVAIWLEGIALVAILALDWRERIDQRKERQEQHKETAAQLAASQKQVEAAIKSADAATTSANAAQESVRLMRQQLQDEAGLGRSVIQTTIDSATCAVAYWKEQKIGGLSPYRLPPTDSLVPADADAAVNHARRISLAIATKLSSAFDDLRNARNEIEGMRHGVKLTGTVTGMYDSNCSRAEKLFDSAWTKLLDAKAALIP